MTQQLCVVLCSCILRTFAAIRWVFGTVANPLSICAVHKTDHQSDKGRHNAAPHLFIFFFATWACLYFFLFPNVRFVRSAGCFFLVVGWRLADFIWCVFDTVNKSYIIMCVWNSTQYTIIIIIVVAVVAAKQTFLTNKKKKNFYNILVGLQTVQHYIFLSIRKPFIWNSSK